VGISLPGALDADGAGPLGGAGPLKGYGCQRVVQDREMNAGDFQGRHAGAGEVVFQEEGALANDEGWQRRLRVPLGQEAGQVPAAIAAAAEAEAGAVEHDLPDRRPAAEKLFLVEIYHGGGDVEQVAPVRVAAPAQAELAQGDAAQ